MGELFWGIKNVNLCNFMVAVKIFRKFIGEPQCKYAVCLKMKSREETTPTGFNRPIRGPIAKTP